MTQTRCVVCCEIIKIHHSLHSIIKNKDYYMCYSCAQIQVKYNNWKFPQIYECDCCSDYSAVSSDFIWEGEWYCLDCYDRYIGPDSCSEDDEDFFEPKVPTYKKLEGYK